MRAPAWLSLLTLSTSVLAGPGHQDQDEGQNSQQLTVTSAHTRPEYPSLANLKAPLVKPFASELASDRMLDADVQGMARIAHEKSGSPHEHFYAELDKFLGWLGSDLTREKAMYVTARSAGSDALMPNGKGYGDYRWYLAQSAKHILKKTHPAEMRQAWHDTQNLYDSHRKDPSFNIGYNMAVIESEIVPGALVIHEPHSAAIHDSDAAATEVRKGLRKGRLLNVVSRLRHRGKESSGEGSSGQGSSGVTDAALATTLNRNLQNVPAGWLRILAWLAGSTRPMSRT